MNRPQPVSSPVAWLRRVLAIWFPVPVPVRVPTAPPERGRTNSSPLRHFFGLLAVLSLTLVSGASAIAQGEDVEEQEELAIRAAVNKVASSVVRIETVGGLEQIGSGQAKMLVGTGPTTGLIVSEDGYVISSAFNFAQKPTSILIGLPDGTRTPAKMVATDYNRMITLLKIDVENLQVENLVVPTAAPEGEIRVGQWAIAVGRTFEGNVPNLSVGIVSATHRIWGKALQTDSKVSPSNYGGPLVDIRGRVLGLLVPLSPQANSEVAGVEWYDSGIGFAVPLDTIYKTVMPKLKEKKDLYPGVMGISFRDQDELAAVPVISVVRAASPAALAGLKSGDKIVAVNGTPISRVMQIRHVIGPLYAGDQIQVTVERDKEKVETQLTLISKLEPFQHPFLGILPLREVDPAQPGVIVRYVYPNSPAAKLEMKPADRIVQLNERQITKPDDLLEAMNSLKFGQAVKLTYKRGDETFAKDVTLAGIPAEIPAELPPARKEREKFAGERPAVGPLKDQKIAEYKNSYAVYVPENYDPAVSYGLLFWLHEPNGFKEDDIIARWKPICDKYDLILVAPKSSEADKWLPNEVEFIHKIYDELAGKYRIDRNRVVAHGYQAGGAMAFLLGFRERELFRGVAAVDATLAGLQASENEPAQRLQFFLTNAKKSPTAKQLNNVAEALKKLKFPVILKDQGDTARNLNDDEQKELARWIDSLDCL